MKQKLKYIFEHRAWFFLNIPLAAVFLAVNPNRDAWSYAFASLLVIGSLIAGFTGKTGGQLIEEWRKRRMGR